MNKNLSKVQLFQDQRVRTVWDADSEEWYFSVVDVVRVLTDQPDGLRARKYWNKLKERLRKEGSETVTNCHQLKMLAEDGKISKRDSVLGSYIGTNCLQVNYAYLKRNQFRAEHRLYQLAEIYRKIHI